MIKIKNLTVKNFMSIGNVTQAVNFDRGDLTLVLGENLDLGSNGSRNGTGKTTLINALSYALYGCAISDIKVNNLINKTNEKNMLVSIDFEINGDEYRIERGRKPNVLKFVTPNKPDVDSNEDDSDAQGDNRETQKEIESILGITHSMFVHAIALNTYTTPFLSEKTNDQRNIIEQLLGITVLTEKAESLKSISKTTKDQIKEEEFRLSAIIKANEHIDEQITSLVRRQRMWQKKKDDDITELSSAIEQLLEVDIDEEIATHKYITETLAQYDKERSETERYNAAVSDCNKWIDQLAKDIVSLERSCTGLVKDIELLAAHKCHACGQDLHDEKQEENKAAKERQLNKTQDQIAEKQAQEEEYKLKLAELGPAPAICIKPHIPETFYNTIDEAHGHKSSLDALSLQLEKAMTEEDPYADQIEDMRNKGLQEVSYDELNRLSELQEHQTFLLKLLTSKDSFIRKKIIDQNLSYLNGRLTHYLREIGLPHQVRFMSDLTVEITDLGRDLDFDNLSRGERNRLILSLSWAFRDVWESLYNHVNLLFVDELVDNGLDTNGVEAAMKIMKQMARERGKSIWLVSHRDELISRAHNVMKVVKEGGFTNYEGLIE